MITPALPVPRALTIGAGGATLGAPHPPCPVHIPNTVPEIRWLLVRSLALTQPPPTLTEIVALSC